MLAQAVRRVGSATLAGVLAIAFVAAAHPVAAECDGPFPSFREVVKTARTIVIGDVVAVDRGGAWDPIDGGLSSRFTLQIVYVVRGASGAVVRIDDMPTQQCAPVIGARLGDRVALAVDGLAFTPPVAANMIAWIDVIPPAEFGPGSMSPADTYTVDEVFALTGQQVPQPPAPAETSFPWPVLLAAILVAVILLIALTRRRLRRATTGDVPDHE